jgi:hypothetical protein
MQTEATTFSPRLLPQVVSRSLQDLAPVSVTIVDTNDRPVSLSEAGYVLHTGRKYRLRICPPTEDLQDVRLISPPEFLFLGSERKFTDAEGRLCYEYTLRVRFNLGAWFSSLRFDELDVELQFTPNSGKQAPLQTIYLVVRPGLGPLVLAALGSAAAIVAPVLFSELLVGKGEETPFGEKLRAWALGPIPWLTLAGLLGVVGGVYGWIRHQLRQRASELQRRFLERYPMPPNGG